MATSSARLTETLAAESLTRVLYPDDSTSMGQGLRFVQEYFLVACSLADLVRRFRRTQQRLERLAATRSRFSSTTRIRRMAVPELMRMLLDEAQLGWDEAWDLTQRSARLHEPHAAARGAREMAAPVVRTDAPPPPGDHLEINRRLLDAVRRRFPGDDGRVARISVIEENGDRKVRMANLAIVGSHSTNGVAAIHSDLLRTRVVRDFAEMFPERFNNKTNGVTPRRWLLLANPRLSSVH